MAGKEEDGNVNTDDNLAESREYDEMMQEISSSVLLHQETSNEQGTSNQPADSSNAPVSSGEAVPAPSSSSDFSRFTDVGKMSLGSSSEEKAPAAVKNDPSLHEKSPATIPSSSNAPTDYKLPDDETVTNSIDYSSSDYDVTRHQLLQQYSSSSSDHVEAEHVTYETHEPAAAHPQPSLQRQILNTFPDVMHQQGELDPRYSASSSNQPMHTRRQQSITTASSFGRSQPISMTEAFKTSMEFVPQARRNQQAMMNPPHYSQYQVPSAAQYGNTTNSPYLPPNQNEGYNMPPPPGPAPFQQLGGTSNMAHYGNTTNSPYLPPNQNEGYNMPPSAAAFQGSSMAYYGNTTNSPYLPPNQNEGYNMPPSPPPAFQHLGGLNMAQYGNTTNFPYSPPNQNEGYNIPPPSAAAAAFQQFGGTSNMAQYGNNMITFPYWRPEQSGSYNMPPQLGASIVPYAYGSANLVGTSSDNVANSRFGYEGGVSSNQLPSLPQHQSVDPNVWPPSSRPSQQHQQAWSDFFATQNQQDDRRYDPSDQTHQRSWPRGN